MKKLLNEYEKPTRSHYQILLMSWAGWVFDFYDLILYTFLLIPIGQELNFSSIELSYVLGGSLAATAIGGIAFGILSDRFGRRSVLQWTILTYSIGTFLSGFASNFSLLLFFRIITGLGVGGEWATGQTYISETFPAKMRGRYGAFMQTGAPIGTALAAVIGGFVAPVIGWRACFFISVLPALLVVVIRKALPESDLWAERKRLIAEGRYQAGTLESEKSYQNFLRLFSASYRKLFILSLVLAIFDMSAYWFTYSWLPGYLHQQRQFSMAKSATWMLVTQVGGFLGYFTFGFVADKLGRRPAYSIYSFIMALGLIMITIMWEVIIVYPPVILGFMFLVGCGTGMFGGYGPLFAELFPTGIRNTAMGSAFNLARGVQFFTPVIIAMMAQKYGLGGGIFLAAFFALLTGAWIWTFPETKGKTLSTLEADG
ncbi:MAG: MFS transporter [bacterium]|uniref:MFS transporter n=1 Tax=Candidatus Methylomirabilis tolerans TaxID=3123416 RepID=A0AAJ1AIM5_9BACT|nr:MFS transporter [Candidatus Methylomirabilis sp.]